MCSGGQTKQRGKQHDYQCWIEPKYESHMTDELSYIDFFPYDAPREGQEDMMQTINQVVREGRNICCEAPNGFGKTCVTLAGVLPWVKENEGKVLYCARTHKQLDRVIEELSAIDDGERVVSGVSFRGRRHMCINPFIMENMDSSIPLSEVCGQLKAEHRCPFYERLRGLDPYDFLDKIAISVLSAPQIIKVAKKRKLCPYELAKKLAKVVDVVALSYLYVFDPFIMSTFIPEIETRLSNVILVQDEAHNVPSTALDSASDSLTLGTIRQAMREANKYNDTLGKQFCRGLAKSVLDLSSEMGDNEEMILKPEGIMSAALENSGVEREEQPLAHMEDLGAKIKIGLLKAGKFPRSTIFRVAKFMQRWVSHSDRVDYAFLLKSEIRRSSRRVSLDLHALDPTSVTQPILSMIRGSVAISGTLSPLEAYSEMLGFENSAVRASFRSPFALKNRIGIIIDGVDTSYKSRGQDVYTQMAEHCAAAANATPGNTGIFTTSYHIGRSLLKMGLEKKLEKKLFLEEQGMKSSENDKMINEFKSRATGKGAVLLGVQGGRNSEGGDFPGETMECVVVVGVPYAKPMPRIDALIAYYDRRFNNRGRDYAYVLPAVTRATQAAGRPVRRLNDRGAIVLLDQRFATPYLRRFLPSWLEEVTTVIPNSPEMLSNRISEFFAS